MGRHDDTPKQPPAHPARPPDAPPSVPAPLSPAGPQAQDDRLLHTTSLLEMLARYRDGNTAALDELLRRIGERLERLARKMLRGYPIVRDREQTDDVLQNALLRLARALREVQPPSTAAFFGLAAEQIRRELLDLARYHRRRASVNQPLPQSGGTLDPVDPNVPDPRDLDRWQALHEAVERLPAQLREVFGLTFYHGGTQQEIAELLGVSDRQVRRLWRQVCLRLHEMLGGDLPAG
jgi:RNA polymerase sigma factor (sigma-70 family)